MPTVELTSEVERVFCAAKALPPSVRARLAEELWDSLDADAPCGDEELEALQREEIRRRVVDYRAGRERTYSEEEVRQNVTLLQRGRELARRSRERNVSVPEAEIHREIEAAIEQVRQQGKATETA